MLTIDYVELVNKLEARTIEHLPTDWQEGRKCPECGSDATRPKCFYEMGPSCPRHDPDAYDESPFVKSPDPLSQEAAQAIRFLAGI